ncbi:hypothetical protein Z052_18170 [Halorubrum sp. C191]|uniref:lactonase family protein n=1 Tax=Halorubrum sp. C191 TaxID=1383842 RepID=UPI000C07844F|nr:lactonase family protein [Halorubrum sp. C191]PHQ40814.1 hypothetical protein Z052_18170 [Halorubrum sp. C191]
MMGNGDIAVIGSYTREGGEGITTHRIETDGALPRIDAADEADPSFLAFHPSGEYLVAVNEREDGSAVSYHVDPATGALDRSDRSATGDAGPCHVAVGPLGEYAVVSHFVGGSVALLSLTAEGELAGPVDLQEHGGSGPNPDRQTAPHPHSAWFVTDSIVYVPDLGTDTLVVYELDRDDGELVHLADAAVSVNPGAGPRHFASHPDAPVGYLLNELDATMTVIDHADPRDPSVEVTVSTLPPEVDADRTIAAEVQVHPGGEYVSTSNRGHDSLATVAVGDDPRDVERTDVTPSGGEWPRNFRISPDGTRLFVCHQHTDDVIPFAIENGELRRLDAPTTVRAPVCIQILAANVSDR